MSVQCADEIKEIHKDVPFRRNAISYVFDLFRALKKKEANGVKITKDMECKDIKKAYVDILQLTEKYTLVDIEPEDIQYNDILVIQCPTLVSEYHYMIAAVGYRGVEVVQAFGRTPVYVTFIKLDQFIQYLNTMKLYSSTHVEDFKDKFKALYPAMKEVETNLYQVEPKVVNDIDITSLAEKISEKETAAIFAEEGKNVKNAYKRLASWPRIAGYIEKIRAGTLTADEYSKEMDEEADDIYELAITHHISPSMYEEIESMSRVVLGSFKLQAFRLMHGGMKSRRKRNRRNTRKRL